MSPIQTPGIDATALSSLPDWSYAGKTLDELVFPKSWIREANGKRVISLPHRYIGRRINGSFAVSPPPDGETRDYVIEEVSGLRGKREYLIPLYAEKEESYHRREERLLSKRVGRFFESAKRDIEQKRTKDQISSDLDHFEKQLALINEERAREGLSEFDPFDSPEVMTERERGLVRLGELCTGCAVERLSRLGAVILQGNKEGIDIEYTEQEIIQNIQDIKHEFGALYTRLSFSSPTMVKCVHTRDDKPDYDGVFEELIREIGKPVLSSFSDTAIADDAHPKEETEVRNLIVTKIADALDAIDQVYADLLQITQSPYFCRLIKQVKANREQKLKDAETRIKILEGLQNQVGSLDEVKQCELYQCRELVLALKRNDIDVSNYKGYLREFRDICRARACVRGNDRDNITPAATRFSQLADELGLINKELFDNTVVKRDADTYSVDKNIESTVRLLKRGIALMQDMAVLRMPRNHAAFDTLRGKKFYIEPIKDSGTETDKGVSEVSVNPPELDTNALIEFCRHDPSSAGRLRREIESHLDIIEPERRTVIGNATQQSPARQR